MTNQVIARDLLAAICILQGLATVGIDLNRIHAANPLWPGHARFHLVWQAVTFAWLALLEVVLVFAAGPYREQCFYLAAILAGIPMLGFLAALIARGTYEGTLSDSNGMKPLIIKFRGSNLRVDLNLVAETIGLLALAAIVAIYKH